MTIKRPKKTLLVAAVALMTLPPWHVAEASRTSLKSTRRNGGVTRDFNLVFTADDTPYTVIKKKLESCPTSWRNRVAPTHFTKILDHYFVVDHWHQRVLFSRWLDPCLANWKVLPGHLNGPHSIASDGKVLVVDSTDDNKLVVYVPFKGGFVRHQEIQIKGERPHKVIYDPSRSSFITITANDQQIVELRRISGLATLEVVGSWKLKLPIDDPHPYCRAVNSYRSGYLAICDNYVIKFDITNRGLQVNSTIPLSDYWKELNDILVLPSSAGLLVTSTRRKFDWIQNLSVLRESRQAGTNTLHETMAMRAIPYYLSLVKNSLYIAEFGQYNRLQIANLFVAEKFQIKNFRIFHDSGHMSSINFNRWFRTCHSCWRD